jgi:signal transduction histidine kinase
MKSGKYIKDRLYSMCIFVAMLIISVLMMAAFKVSVQLIIAEIFIMIICYIAVVLADYYHRKKFYDELEANIAALEEKYLITETLVRPAFYEGQIFYDSVSDIDRSMTENVKRYRQGMEQFKEYVEMWIHEIKLPIASLTLMLHNNMNTQIRRINNYIEQILYYVRSENAEKDYIINDARLSKIISNVALKNKDDLLENDITFEVSNADRIVLTDAKWMEFMLNQIVNNSIKYKDKTKAESYIKMSAAEDKKCVVLEILDNGIGINASDLPLFYPCTLCCYSLSG